MRLCDTVIKYFMSSGQECWKLPRQLLNPTGRPPGWKSWFCCILQFRGLFCCDLVMTNMTVVTPGHMYRSSPKFRGLIPVRAWRRHDITDAARPHARGARGPRGPRSLLLAALLLCVFEEQEMSLVNRINKQLRASNKTGKHLDHEAVLYPLAV